MNTARKILLLFLASVSIAQSQDPPLVTISDYVRTPFNTPFKGRVTITLRYSGPLAANNATLAAGFMRLDVLNGSLTVQLVPNAAIAPSGTSYNVRYVADTGFAWEETWVVPAVPATNTIANVRVSTAPSPSVLIAPQQISTVGALPGQVLLYNGSTVTWGTVSGGGGSSVWGAITGVLSNQTDLWNELQSKAAAVHTHALSSLQQSGASVGQVPMWNGTAWVPSNPPTGSGSLWSSGTGGAIYYNGGNVGIGTSTPSAALDVIGTVKATALQGALNWSYLAGVPSTFPPESHQHSAADITSGTISAARLGSGTASASTFLRGDQTWAQVPVTSVFGRTGAVTASAGDYTASQITNSPSGNIAATTVQAAINELDAEKAAVVHTHAAADITSGTIAAARLGTGTPGSSNFLRGDQTWASVAWADVTGKPTTFPPESHVHSASDITTGTIATARLGSGTASSSTFLRGDQSWASVGWNDVASKPSSFPPSSHSHLLTDLDSGGASTGQALVWNGTQWAPATISGGGGGSGSATGYVMVVPATCQLGAASTGLVLPTSGYPTPVCLQGSNVTTAALDFADTQTQSVQGQLVLAGTISSIDLQLKWRTAATNGSVVWQLQTACVADGESSDPAWNTAQLIVDDAKTTALQHNDATLANVTLTGCASGKTMYWRLLRDPAHASDTINASAQLLSILWVINR